MNKRESRRDYSSVEKGSCPPLCMPSGMQPIYFNKVAFLFIFLILFPAGKIHAQKLERASAAYPQLTNIPTLYINTTNSAPITSKDIYIPGTLVAVSSDSREEILGSGSGVAIEIRGRGNSTWNLAKKPYRVKFGSKTNFLNLPAKAKSWVLLANYADKSLLRNAVADKISELIGLEFTPAAKFVDVVLNGKYIGNYMVSDQVQVHANRVAIDEQDGTITALPYLSGGYLLEVDGFAGSEPVWFATGRGLPITIKSPDDAVINQAQKDYIISFTQRFEDALFSSDFKDPDLGYRALVDTNSLINWYIGCELTGNSDSFWSIYIYKKRNIDKFFFGPMWDYDIAFNNDNRLGDATEKLMREYAHDPKPWIRQMWKDEWFRGAVYGRWMQLLENDKIIAQLVSYIDQTAALIDASQKKNYQTWGNLSTPVYLEQNLFNTYSEYVAYLKTYLNSRSNFLTQRFSDKPLPPFVAERFYYKILNVNTNNAIQVRNQSTAPNAPLEMWAPQSGNNNQEWEIKPLDNDKFQIIHRKSGLAITGAGWINNLIQTAPDAGNTAQQWTIIPLESGNVYGIVNIKSGYAIDNYGGNSQNGTAAIEYNEQITENKNQQWYLTKTEPIEDITAIRQVNTNHLSVSVSAGVLQVNNLTGNNVISIYTLSGQLVSTVKTGNDTFNRTLNRGNYILTVRGENNHSQVFVVK